MADTGPRHVTSERFDEERLHRAFRHYHTLGRIAREATATVAERRNAVGTRESVASQWRGAPPPWKERWDHLSAATRDWQQRPEQMQRRLDAIAADYARTGTTDLASPIQVRNLLFAAELASHWSDYSDTFSPATPRLIDHTFGYHTGYFASGGSPTSNSLPSWSSARQWLIAQAEGLDPHAHVNYTISGPDPYHGGPGRALMTGFFLTPRELVDQLHHFDELLGTTPLPVDPDAQSWLDELRCDILIDAYRDTLLELANPWAGIRRYEHYLRADDLYTDIIDYADRAGIGHAAERLDAIRHSTEQLETQWRTAPRPGTWLDDAVNDAQRRLNEFDSGGIALTYPDQTVPNGLTLVGFGDNSWYAEQAHTGEDGRTVVYESPPQLYSSYAELLVMLEDPATAVAFPSAPRVPEDITSRLGTFVDDRAALQQELSAVRGLRDAVRARTSYLIQSDTLAGGSSERTTQRHSAASRDANRITLTNTPVSEEPTPAPEPKKPARPRRAQPSKSTGRQHRRRH